MPIEIERKFLVNSTDCLTDVKGIEIIQGYLPMQMGIVRIRIADEKAFLTIKGSGLISRPEFEYPIPLKDARELLELFCEDRTLSKTRYSLPRGRHLITIDLFHGDNEGLILAEIELEDENETIEHPDWLGKDVSHDPRYHNSNLIKNPFNKW